MLIHCRHYFDFIPRLTECRLQKLKVNRRHLRTNDGILLLHFLCEKHTVQGGIPFLHLHMLFPSVLNRRNQGADTNTRRTKVIYLINLQGGINLAGSCQNRFHLIGCYGIQAAAEGVQLYKFDILLLLYKCRRFIQSGMIRPLVTHNGGTFHMSQMRHAVLRQNGNAVACNQFGNPVVNFRVCMVGSACQNNPGHVIFTDIFQRFLAFFAHISAEIVPFLPAGFHCRLNLLGITAHGYKFLLHTLDDGFNFIQRKEGIHEFDILFLQILYVVFDIFIIGCHDRAVIVIIRRGAVPSFVNHAGIEDKINACVNQPHDMPMHQLCRVANGFTGDGFHAHLKYRLGGEGRKHNPVSQLGKEGIPEGVILKHIQHTRDTDCSLRCLLCRQGFIIEQSMAFIIIQVGRGVFNFFLAQTSFTAVACDEASAAAEQIDRQQAVVGAALTSCHIGMYFQCVHFIAADECGLIACGVFISGNQPCAEGPHDACDIGTDCLSAADHFKAFQHRIIVEGTALYNHGFPHCLRVGNLDDLKQCIFDNGIRQTCGDIRNLCALLLCLLHAGIHKYRTSGAKINGIFCKQRSLCEIHNGIIQRFCEGFDEGATAGGACLIQQNAVDYIILNADTFHILSADVQNKVHIRLEELRRLIMCNGFNIAKVNHQGFLNQPFAIACHAGIANHNILRHHIIHFIQAFHDNIQRIALIACIEGIEQIAILGNQSHLCCGRACIHTKEGIPMIIRQGHASYLISVMAFLESGIIRFILKQRLHTGNLCRQLHAVIQLMQQCIKIQLCFALIGNGCAVSGEQMGIFRNNRCFIRQLQCFNEAQAQLGKEMQRAA